jgi:glycosyltransferase involved in cell wall biosynthesis
LLQRTLESLAACEKPANYAGVVVVENGPRSGLDAVVSHFAPGHQFRYLYSQAANKSLALNRALEQLSDALVVFTDDDVQAPRHTLMAYAQATAGRTSGEFYGGPIIPDYEGSPPPPWLVPLLPRSAAGWKLDASERIEIFQPEFIGPNFAAFAANVLRVGGFDTRLGPGSHMLSPGEDTEIQERLLAARVRGFYVPDAAMQHHVRNGSATLEFAAHRAERNGLYWGISQARRSSFFPRRYAKTYSQWLNDLWRIRRWRRSRESGLQARAECLQARWRGRWEGIRLGRHWDRVGLKAA